MDNEIPLNTIRGRDLPNDLQTIYWGYDQPAHDDGHLEYTITNRDWQDDFIEAVQFYDPSVEITVTSELKQLLDKIVEEDLQKFFSQFGVLSDFSDNPDDIYRLGEAARASANPVTTID